MPLYEYKCEKCGEVFDAFARDPNVPKDHGCGGEAKRLFSAPTFKFNFWYGYDIGSGRYYDSDRERNNDIAERGLSKIKD